MSVPFYTPQEDALLTKLWRAGVPTMDIARRLTRSVESLKHRARRLGLGEHPNFRNRYLLGPPIVTEWRPENNCERHVEAVLKASGGRGFPVLNVAYGRAA